MSTRHAWWRAPQGLLSCFRGDYSITIQAQRLQYRRQGPLQTARLRLPPRSPAKVAHHHEKHKCGYEQHGEHEREVAGKELWIASIIEDHASLAISSRNPMEVVKAMRDTIFPGRYERHVKGIFRNTGKDIR